MSEVSTATDSGSGGTAPGGSHKGGAGRILLWIGGGLLLLMLLGSAAIYGGYRWMQNEFVATGPALTETTLLLPPGAGLIRIAQRLETEGLVSDARVFRFSVELDGGERALRAGEYLIPARSSMADIYQLLREGETVQHAITLAEGLTSAMIVALIQDADLLEGELDSVPAEGSLLPETYLFVRGTARSDVIARMRRAQETLINQLWDGRAENLPFETREDALILASIVEKETGISSERDLVASVFVNRLRRGMRLESDPTIIYGITGGEPLGRGLRRSEIDSTTNVWNTYQIPRLPPTPIANPGREAIAAVLNPATTSALFFVADGSGGHVFADTYAEHLRNVAQWRRIERQR